MDVSDVESEPDENANRSTGTLVSCLDTSDNEEPILKKVKRATELVSNCELQDHSADFSGECLSNATDCQDLTSKQAMSHSSSRSSPPTVEEKYDADAHNPASDHINSHQTIRPEVRRKPNNNEGWFKVEPAIVNGKRTYNCKFQCGGRNSSLVGGRGHSPAAATNYNKIAGGTGRKYRKKHTNKNHIQQLAEEVEEAVQTDKQFEYLELKYTARNQTTVGDNFRARNHRSTYGSFDDCGDDDSSLQNRNVMFYMNQIESRPNGAKIDDILRDWYGDYDRLEMHHGYIQWLFPISEPGMNSSSQQLKPHEATEIAESEVCIDRLIKAYKLMLDFFGLRLVDRESGNVVRSSSWFNRLGHINRSHHNFLRITRIIRCFGELGQSHLQAPFVERLIEEAFIHKTLTDAQTSCKSFWIPAVCDEGERKRLLEYIGRYRTMSSWSPKQYIF